MSEASEKYWFGVKKLKEGGWSTMFMKISQCIAILTKKYRENAKKHQKNSSFDQINPINDIFDQIHTHELDWDTF